MQNPEYESSHSQKERDETGFSEEEMDLDVEVRAGEWRNLKKIKSYRARSRQGKIIATYQAVSNRLNQLVSLYYKFVASNPTQAKKMLEELKELRMIQEILLNCLVWSQQGRLEKDMIPANLWEIIE